MSPLRTTSHFTSSRAGSWYPNPRLLSFPCPSPCGDRWPLRSWRGPWLRKTCSWLTRPLLNSVKKWTLNSLIKLFTNKWSSYTSTKSRITITTMCLQTSKSTCPSLTSHHSTKDCCFVWVSGWPWSNYATTCFRGFSCMELLTTLTNKMLSSNWNKTGE